MRSDKYNDRNRDNRFDTRAYDGWEETQMLFQSRNREREELKKRKQREEAYREYQLALRSFNQQLTLLGEVLGLNDRLSSYTARHTWATTAYYCEIHPGIISEAMGHSSIKVTETYLKPFRNKKIDEANNQIIDFVKHSIAGVVS